MTRVGQADVQYKKLVDEILENGLPDNPETVRPKFKDGEPATTISIIGHQMRYDNSGDEAFLPTTKHSPSKDPVKELLWIWQKQSNKVSDLQAMGCSVWDEEELEDGTIGLAYGWQLANKKRKVIADELYVDMLLAGQFSVRIAGERDVVREAVIGQEVYLNQVDYLLYHLKKNPESRRIKTTLYCFEDLDDMSLEPCVFDTQWQVLGGKLHVQISARSQDVALGNVYNVYQYQVLHKMFAQVSGLVPGAYIFEGFNMHVYERHIPTLLEQMENPMLEPATLTLNPDVTSFYDFTVEDVRVENYQHAGKYHYEKAV